MKEVKYGYHISHSPELLALARERTFQLEELLGKRAIDVSAEWDSSRDAQGQPVVTLRLSDFSGSATSVFSREELASESRTLKRLRNVWLDLLEVSFQKQLHQLQEAGSAEGA